MKTWIEKLPDGRYRGHYDAGRVGDQRPRGHKTCDRRKDVVDWLEDRKKDEALGLMGTPRSLTVAVLLDQWLASPKTNGQPRGESTLRGYRQVIRDHIKPAIGTTPVRDLDSDAIEACIKAMADKGLSAGTQSQAWAVIHASLKWGRKKRKYRGENPADYADRPAPAKVEMNFLEVDEARRMLAELEQTHAGWDRKDGNPPSVLFAPVLIALATGARRSEVLRLRWCDVDLETGETTILKSKTKAGVRPVTIAPWALAPLKRHRKREQAMVMRLGLGWSEERPVCAQWATASGADVGGPLNVNSVSGLFRRWADRHGFEGIRFHDLRHTQVPMLVAAGIHPKVIQERMGHESFAFTMDRYGHLFRGMERDAAAALPDLTASASE